MLHKKIFHKKLNHDVGVILWPWFNIQIWSLLLDIYISAIQNNNIKINNVS